MGSHIFVEDTFLIACNFLMNTESKEIMLLLKPVKNTFGNIICSLIEIIVRKSINIDFVQASGRWLRILGKDMLAKILKACKAIFFQTRDFFS